METAVDAGASSSAHTPLVSSSLYIHSKGFLRTRNIAQFLLITMENPILHPFVFLYVLWQNLLNLLLSPNAPQPGAKLARPKIAIIGAGLTGVSAASHCVGHGFDVQIFEAGPKKNLGGIWSVNLS
jgi:NADPH-dependent 2,4-dienoyl-CoA reductase/sulfur reductase-like enzyme